MEDNIESREKYSFPNTVWVVRRIWQHTNEGGWEGDNVAVFPNKEEAEAWALRAEESAIETYKKQSGYMQEESPNTIPFESFKVPGDLQRIPTKYDPDALVEYYDDNGPCICYTSESVPFFWDRIQEKLSR